MDRKNFYYKRPVTKDDLNGIQDYIEDAMRAISADMGMWGIFSGLDLAETVAPSVAVNITVGGSYAGGNGKRMEMPSPETLDCSVDYLGNTTYTDMSSGYGRWLGVFIAPATVESDSETDGHGASVKFEIAESYTLKVYKGSSDIVANKASLTHPGVVVGEIKIGDLWMERDNPNIVTADIDLTERQDLYRDTVFGTDINGGTIKQYITDLNSALNGIHITDVTMDGDVIPETTDVYDLGSTAKKFKDLHLIGNIVADEITLTDDINLLPTKKVRQSATPDTLTRIFHWSVGSSGDTSTNTWTPSSSYVSNIDTGVNWYCPITLPPGATLTGATIDWDPINANVAEMNFSIKKYTFGTPGESLLGELDSSASGRSADAISAFVAHPVSDGDTIVARIDCTTAADKIYAIKIEYTIAYWPI